MKEVIISFVDLSEMQKDENLPAEIQPPPRNKQTNKKQN